MPTSNQTDTNNNSNNKITNGVVMDAREAALEIVSPTAANNIILTNNSSSQTIANTRQGQNQQQSFTSPIKYSEQQQQMHQLQQQQPSQNHINHNNVHSQQQQQPHRSLEELTQLLKDINFDRTSLTNEELIRLVKNQRVSVYKLESFLGKDNAARCVEVRRDFYRLMLAELDKVDQLGINDRASAFNKPSYSDLEYEKVNGACCENVIGHVKVPVGVAGPLVLDGEEIFVPLATTEGCLVASTCRGLSALRKSGGVSSRVRKDFMTRAPIIRFTDTKLTDALYSVERAIAWLNDRNNKEKMRAAFNLTSSHGKFLNYTLHPVSREIHIRFEAQTGDAMGMNMCSKGVESALKEMQRAFPTMEIVTLSGNMCTDKKAAGINWINGRGKSVECNAELPAHVVQQVFKVSVDSMIDRWKSKVMVGSALAASIGGFNSQAANILTAIFIATGQDPAQNVTSSNCMLILEKDSKGSLVVCCTMPSIECGTVGGGTILGDQSRYLQMMGVKGPTPEHLTQSYNSKQRQQQQQQQHNNLNGDGNPSSGLYINNNSNSNLHSNNVNSNSDCSTAMSQGATSASAQTIPPSSKVTSIVTPINSMNGYTNARKLARIICATVMAAELSLLAALTEGTLVKSHMRHNRSSTSVTTSALSSSNSCFGSNLFFHSTRLQHNSNSNSMQSSEMAAWGGGGGGGGGGPNSLC